ncbi:amidohydrolase family protein [Amycolatopsis sp.]|uniref:amidohydrolase family protein n=1 Tax=Amycolatopsis sp. TaxID=37632 RepID=UPI002CCCC0F7|nr:amidohydrolase family protein [Amycolatopsis sp.]HVV08291.1 amidohydrolase family protein [Amycolatopsis sp.]
MTNGLLLTMADGQEPFTGWLSVGADGRITGIGRGDPPAAEGTVLDAKGKMIAPGFVSAHSHLHTSGLRGLAAGETLYPWVRANNEVLLGAADEDMYWFVLHGCLDFLANGITSAYNFALSRVIWLYDEKTGDRPGQVRAEDFVNRQFDAAAESGLRVLTAIRLDDEAFGRARALDNFGKAAGEVRARTPHEAFLGISVYGAVQWSGTPATAGLEAEVMARYGITNQAHFVETAENLPAQQAKFDWYARAGALGPGMVFGHFVHPTDEMVDAVAAAGCAVVWQPTSNGRLGSGIADVVRYRERGIRVGMGLDDQSCTDISDPFGNMRMGLYTQRARRSQASVLMPREVLRMHTLGSAEVLGVADLVGSLEVGKFADFLVVDPAQPDTGPMWDVYATYVLACGQRNLKEVYLGGRCRTVDGEVRHPLAAQARTELHVRLRHAARRRGLPEPFRPDQYSAVRY